MRSSSATRCTHDTVQSGAQLFTLMLSRSTS
jgi:hypothetical protein